MSIELKSVKCPDCGASLPIEEGRTQIFCSYCGSKIIITNENEHIYRHVDDAEVKRAEADNQIRLKELELEEKENDRNRKSKRVAYIISLISLVVGIIFIAIDNWTLGGILVMASILIAEFTFIGNHPHNKSSNRKAQRILSANEVQITDAMSDPTGDNYNAVVALYKAAGFVNIRAIPLNDLNFLKFKNNELVENVTINGDDSFESGDVFKNNDNVIITYHSMH